MNEAKFNLIQLNEAMLRGFTFEKNVPCFLTCVQWFTYLLGEKKFGTCIFWKKE